MNDVQIADEATRDAHRALTKPPKYRSESSIELLVKWVHQKHIKFFEDLATEHDEETLQNVLRVCSLRDVQAEETLACAGDVLPEMYAILVGELVLHCSQAMGEAIEEGMRKDQAPPILEPPGGMCMEAGQRVSSRAISRVCEGEELGSRTFLSSLPFENAITATQRAFLLVLHRDDFRRVVEGVVSDEPTREHVQFLRSTYPPFAACPPSFLANLVYFCDETTFAVGQTVSKQGLVAEWVVFVLSGECKLVREASVDVRARSDASPLTAKRVRFSTELAILGPGAVVCEDSVLHKSPMPESVVCLREMRTLTIARDEFLRQVKSRAAKRAGLGRTLLANARVTREWRDRRNQHLLSHRIASTDTIERAVTMDGVMDDLEYSWGRGQGLSILEKTAAKQGTPSSALQWGGIKLLPAPPNDSESQESVPSAPNNASAGMKAAVATKSSRVESLLGEMRVNGAEQGLRFLSLSSRATPTADAWRAWSGQAGTRASKGTLGSAVQGLQSRSKSRKTTHLLNRQSVAQIFGPESSFSKACRNTQHIAPGSGSNGVNSKLNGAGGQVQGERNGSTHRAPGRTYVAVGGGDRDAPGQSDQRPLQVYTEPVMAALRQALARQNGSKQGTAAGGGGEIAHKPAQGGGGPVIKASPRSASQRARSLSSSAPVDLLDQNNIYSCFPPAHKAVASPFHRAGSRPSTGQLPARAFGDAASGRLQEGRAPPSRIAARTTHSHRQRSAVVARPHTHSPAQSAISHPTPTTRRETNVPLAQPIPELDHVSTNTTEPVFTAAAVAKNFSFPKSRIMSASTGRRIPPSSMACRPTSVPPHARYASNPPPSPLPTSSPSRVSVQIDHHSGVGIMVSGARRDATWSPQRSLQEEVESIELGEEGPEQDACFVRNPLYVDVTSCASPRDEQAQEMLRGRVHRPPATAPARLPAYVLDEAPPPVSPMAISLLPKKPGLSAGALHAQDHAEDSSPGNTLDKMDSTGLTAGPGVVHLLSKREHHRCHPNMGRRASLPGRCSTSPRRAHMAPSLPGSTIKSKPRTSRIRSQPAEVGACRISGDSNPFQLDPRLKRDCSPHLRPPQATARCTTKPGADSLNPQTSDDFELSLIAPQRENLSHRPPQKSAWAEQFSGAVKMDNFPNDVIRGDLVDCLVQNGLVSCEEVFICSHQNSFQKGTAYVAFRDRSDVVRAMVIDALNIKGHKLPFSQCALEEMETAIETEQKVVFRMITRPRHEDRAACGIGDKNLPSTRPDLEGLGPTAVAATITIKARPQTSRKGRGGGGNPQIRPRSAVPRVTRSASRSRDSSVWK